MLEFNQAQQSFVDLLVAMEEGEMPLIEGVDPQYIETIYASLIIDIQDGADGASHFNQVLEANGLTKFDVNLGLV